MGTLPELTVIGEKGQVVIPQRLRKRLRLTRGTRFVVYGSGDVVILKRLELRDLGAKWRQVLKAVDSKHLRISARDIRREVAAVRRERRRAGK
jgi:AbrB family looped-hinge helix DNA binding protein